MALVQVRQERSRRRVVQYLFDVVGDFGLRNTTWFLAVNYFDRYAAASYLRCGCDGAARVEPVVGSKRSQLVASTCLLIAAKFADRKLPPLSQLVLLHDDGTCADDFVQMELSILRVLNYGLRVTPPCDFVEVLALLVHADDAARRAALRLADLSLYESDFLALTARQLAGVAVAGGLVHARCHERDVASLCVACCLGAEKLSSWRRALMASTPLCDV